MPRKLKAVTLLLESVLPEDLRNDSRIYDAKGVGDLLAEVARRYPERYAEIAKHIGDVGRKSVWDRGETFVPSDFETPTDLGPVYAALSREEAGIRATVKDPVEQKRRLAEVYGKYTAQIGDLVAKAALERRSNVALSVLSGARGKKDQLQALVGTPGFYVDPSGQLIPLFARRSFAEGQRPAEYLASTYGARRTVVSTKRMVAQGGAWAKSAMRAAATMRVTDKDCGTANGIDLDINEPDLRGRVLQRPAGGLPAGTVLDRKAMASLRAAKVSKVIVRSPLTCDAPEGLCSRCLGVKANGRFPNVGDDAGMTASQSIGEPLAQAALNMKHNPSAKGPKTEFSGFEYIEQFTDSPENFKDRAVVSSREGSVNSIVEAPQGGWLVDVGGEEHYIPPDRQLVVSVGDKLEEGDSISDGLIDPEDIIIHKGLGEGRRYYAEELGRIADRSGAGTDRRNLEVLARSVIDHIQLEDPEEEGWLPDDVVRYSKWLRRRQPDPDTKEVPAREAVGQYLQAPALHHTVGTRITPSILRHLEEAGWDKVHVSATPPTAKPVMLNLAQVPATDEDWLAAMNTSYLGRQFSDNIVRARDTNIESNIHYAPRLAVGEDFGKNLAETGKF